MTTTELNPVQDQKSIINIFNARSDNPNGSLIILSVVSHGQGALVGQFFDDLDFLQLPIQVILTLNIQEDDAYAKGRQFPLTIIKNKLPLGFGANHNQAFRYQNSDFFIIANPDIRLDGLDLQLLMRLFSDENTGACAPKVVSTAGVVEDSVRQFPTLYQLIKKTFFRRKGIDYQVGSHAIAPDWVAGMFVIFRSCAYRDVGGFDEKNYFMYYEDVDICHTLWEHGWSVWYEPSTYVIHNAQRDSHRKMRYLAWHFSSIFKYLTRRWRVQRKK
jgi:GT2 family glycosyltransferase